MNFEEKVIGLLEGLNTKVDALGARMDKLEARFAVIEADVAQLKTDVSQLKTDVSQLKADTEQLKVDTEQLKADTEQLKVDTEQLKTDTEQLKADTARNADRITAVAQEMSRQSDMLIDFKERLVLHETDYTQRFTAALDGWKNALDTDVSIKKQLTMLDLRIDFIERQKYELHQKDFLSKAVTA